MAKHLVAFRVADLTSLEYDSYPTLQRRVFGTRQYPRIKGYAFRTNARSCAGEIDVFFKEWGKSVSGSALIKSFIPTKVISHKSQGICLFKDVVEECSQFVHMAVVVSPYTYYPGTEHVGFSLTRQAFACNNHETP